MAKRTTRTKRRVRKHVEQELPIFNPHLIIRLLPLRIYKVMLFLGLQQVV